MATDGQQETQLAPAPQVQLPGTTGALRESELRIAIDTAHRYPRKLSAFIHDATVMATIDAQVAESCYYTLKRKGADGEPVKIQGPSIRLMEICASAWGNIRYGALDIKFDDEFTTAIGFSHDVEKNVERVTITKRRITNRQGRRYSADMLMVTGNAAAAIAARNALRGVIPEALVIGLMRKAQATVKGDIPTFKARLERWLDFFVKEKKVPLPKVLEYIEVKGREDIGWDQLEELAGLATAITDGETTIEAEFAEVKPAGVPEEKTGAQKVSEKIQQGTQRLGSGAGEQTGETLDEKFERQKREAVEKKP